MLMAQRYLKITFIYVSWERCAYTILMKMRDSLIGRSPADPDLTADVMIFEEGSSLGSTPHYQVRYRSATIGRRVRAD